MARPAVAAVLAALAAACAQPPSAPGGPPPPPVQARADVDRAVATTGDVLTFRVTVEHAPDWEVDIPEAGAEIAGFRVIDLGRDEPVRSRGRVTETRWYKLRADLVGSYILPAVTISYRRAGGDDPAAAEAEGEDEAAENGAGEAFPPSGTLETSEIFVEVQSVLPADGQATDIRDIKPLRRVDTGPPWWLFAAGGAVVLAAAVAAWLIRRRRRSAPTVPAIPPHEVAFRELDALRETDFDDPAAARRFCFAVSGIVRSYVEGRFGLNATDLTTEEILGALDGIDGLPAGERDRLRGFLTGTDRVKFAGHVPSRPEIRRHYENALTFVETTRPAAEPVPEKEAA